MTSEEAREVLGDVRAYLASRASLENEMLAGHTFTDICNAIKALERQTSEDCVSRDALRNLKISVPIAPVFIDDNHIKYRDAVFYDDIIDLPSVTPKAEWIPVSERLPKKIDDVLAYDGVDMFVAWHSSEGEWNSSDNCFERDTPIIAWMPLPQPYKAEGEEKE